MGRDWFMQRCGRFNTVNTINSLQLCGLAALERALRDCGVEDRLCSSWGKYFATLPLPIWLSFVGDHITLKRPALYASSCRAALSSMGWALDWFWYSDEIFLGPVGAFGMYETNSCSTCAALCKFARVLSRTLSSGAMTITGLPLRSAMGPCFILH